MPPFGWTFGLSVPGVSTPPGRTLGWTFGLKGTLGALLSASLRQSERLSLQLPTQSLKHDALFLPPAGPHLSASAEQLISQLIYAASHLVFSAWLMTAPPGRVVNANRASSSAGSKTNH
jgi:hypothetical protein